MRGWVYDPHGGGVKIPPPVQETYSHEKYEPTFFASGELVGTPEEGLDVGAVYLQG
ncbi:MAG TPA: hypothetical protein VGQ83_00575 [Polyangia bacterium]|jgi:hypothetical protein